MDYKEYNSELKDFITFADISSLIGNVFPITEEGLIELPSTKSLLFSKSGVSPLEVVKIIESSSQKVNDFLTDTERGFGLSLKQIKTLNCFDFRPFFKNKNITYDEDRLGPKTGYPRLENKEIAKVLVDATIDESFATKYPFFSLLPCFEEGTIRLNSNRWLYWKIIDLSIDEKRCVVRLQDYAGCGKYWSLGVTTEWEITPNNITNLSFCNSDDYVDEILNIVDFTKDEGYVYKKIWRYNQKYKNLEKDRELREKSKSSLISMYMFAMLLVNKSLSANKLSKGKAVKNTTSHKEIKTELTPQEPQEAKKKLVRTLVVSKEDDANNDAEILITSDKVPKVPSEEYVRHYSVAAWKTRATVRHYKSGKTVYVKECVHHRHALQKDSEESEVAKREYKVK